MVSFAEVPLPLFINHYPKGLEGIQKIKGTFRTPTGKAYGPDFIEIGLTVGRALHKILQTEFALPLSP